MELCRDDFRSVLIAEGGWGPIDKKVAMEAPGLKRCDECSTDKHVVFHNARGEQKHIGEEELKRNVDRAMWNLD